MVYPTARNGELVSLHLDAFGHIGEKAMESNVDMNQVVTGVTLVKACSIKADKDSNEHKTINVKIKFDGTTMQSVFNKAVAGAVIQWQNGPGRNGFDKWVNGQTVEISFKAPAAQAQLSPAEQLKVDAIAAGVDVSNKDAFKAFVIEQMNL